MGYIYKIYNDINNKIYIGKTCETVEKRFQEHLKDYNKRDEENRPLYRAMKKYGVEHFFYEILEKCANEQELNIREQYWIKYYNSYQNGYNATLGGDGKCLYDHSLILEKLQQGLSPQKIQIEIGCCIDIIYNVAKNNNINLKQRALNNQKKEVYQFDKQGQYIQAFDGISEAAEWCLKNNLSKGEVSTIRKKISGCVNKGASRKTAYGYVWSFDKE